MGVSAQSPARRRPRRCEYRVSGDKIVREIESTTGRERRFDRATVAAGARIGGAPRAAGDAADLRAAHARHPLDACSPGARAVPIDVDRRSGATCFFARVACRANAYREVTAGHGRLRSEGWPLRGENGHLSHACACCCSAGRAHGRCNSFVLAHANAFSLVRMCARSILVRRRAPARLPRFVRCYENVRSCGRVRLCP